MNRFHLSTSAAEVYERQKVPAIFAPLAEATLDAISLPSSANVLDVACGTGSVARAVAARLAEPSRITGTDLNPAMIEVARRNTPAGPHSFDWLAASVDAMPFEDSVFDLVFCQQGLQFFPDRPAALGEIRRVMRPGGRLILTCWAAVPPFFTAMGEVLGRHIDEAAAARAVDPFVWNEPGLVRQLVSAAGFDCPEPSPLTLFRTVAASSDAIREEILGSPNENAFQAVGEAARDAILADILDGVARYRDGDVLRMPQPANLFEATAR